MGVTLVTRMVNDGGGSVQVNLQGFKAFRIIRVTRILKTLRLVRVFRFIMALRTLVTSIVYTLKSLFWAMALLMLIIFVFSVLLVEAVSDHWGSLDNPNMPPEDAENIQAYFASLPHAMLSLFMSISGGVSWEEVISPLGKISNVCVVVYLFYISFTYFAVLNVVTGVFCQSAIDTEDAPMLFNPCWRTKRPMWKRSRNFLVVLVRIRQVSLPMACLRKGSKVQP